MPIAVPKLFERDVFSIISEVPNQVIILELPARATVVKKGTRRFGMYEKAQDYVMKRSAPTLVDEPLLRAEQKLRDEFLKELEKQLPPLGHKFRLKQDVERFDSFLAGAGLIGVVDVVDVDFISLKMDEPLPGAQYWGNCIEWYENPLEDNDFLTRFYDDCEPL